MARIKQKTGDESASTTIGERSLMLFNPKGVAFRARMTREKSEKIKLYLLLRSGELQ